MIALAYSISLYSYIGQDNTYSYNDKYHQIAEHYLFRLYHNKKMRPQQKSQKFKNNHSHEYHSQRIKRSHYRS